MKVRLLFQLNLKKLNRVKASFHTSTKAVLSRSQQNVLGQLRLYTYVLYTMLCWHLPLLAYDRLMSIPARFILLQRVSRLLVVSELTRKGPLSGNLQGNQCTFSFMPYYMYNVRWKKNKGFKVFWRSYSETNSCDCSSHWPFCQPAIQLDIFQIGVTYCKFVKVVCRNRSGNHCKCNRSDTLPSISIDLVTTTRALLLY